MRQGSPYVAIVDDDDSVRKSLARLLLANAFKIETFGSAPDFLASAGTNPPDCVLLDLHMPEMSGLDLLMHLQRTHASFPTIVVTAHNEPGLRQRCASAGASAFLVKPLNAPLLLEAIKTAVANSEERPKGHTLN
jgi:FixJ family two-component response regulator